MSKLATCVFCRIIAGASNAAVVLDEPSVLAFLDHSPVFPGHVLVVPKHHHVTLPQLPTAEIGSLFEAVQRVTSGVEAALGAEGSWVSMNNVVSQSVPHLHVHVVPRRRKDGLRGFYWPRAKYPSEAAMYDVALQIRERIVGKAPDLPSDVWTADEHSLPPMGTPG